MRLIEAYKDGRLNDMDIDFIMAPVTFVGTSLNQSGGPPEHWVRHFPKLLKEYKLLRRQEKKSETY
jgi:hypothetical protein